jgi:hypothetical protein
MEDITSQKQFPGLQHSLKLLTNGICDNDDRLLGFCKRKMLFKESVITGVTLHTRKLSHIEAYPITPKKKNFFQEADCCPTGKEILPLLWNPKVHKSLPLAHILNQLNPF